MTEGDFRRASARSAPKSVSPEMTSLCSSRATDYVVVCLRESVFEGMDSVVACFAPQLSKSR
jgi:hypothetical protein